MPIQHNLLVSVRLSDLNRAKAVVLKLTKSIHPAFAPAYRPTNSVKIASAIALPVATDQSGLDRSDWVQSRIMSPAVVVCFFLSSADTQIFALSTVPWHQHSSPMSLLFVLVWVSLLEIGVAGWVPRVLRGACRLADYPPELTIKSICLWCRQNKENGRVYSDRYAKIFRYG